MNTASRVPLPAGGWYRFVLVGGAAPLAAGIGIFLAWLATGRPGFTTAGLLLIAAGTGVVAVAAGVLITVTRQGLRSGEMPRRQVLRRALGAGLLLLANFPVALGLAVLAADLHGRWRVRVVNDGARPASCRLFGGGLDRTLGPIPAGDDEAVWLGHQGDGELRCEVTIASGVREAVVVGYVTNSLGGRAVVRIRPDGGLDVESRGH